MFVVFDVLLLVVLNELVVAAGHMNELVNECIVAPVNMVFCAGEEPELPLLVDDGILVIFAFCVEVGGATQAETFAPVCVIALLAVRAFAISP